MLKLPRLQKAWFFRFLSAASCTSPQLQQTPFSFKSRCFLLMTLLTDSHPVPVSSSRPLLCRYSAVLHHMLCCNQLASSTGVSSMSAPASPRTSQGRAACWNHSSVFRVFHVTSPQGPHKHTSFQGCLRLLSRRLALCQATRASCLWPFVMLSHPRQSLDSLARYHNPWDLELVHLRTDCRAAASGWAVRNPRRSCTRASCHAWRHSMARDTIAHCGLNVGVQERSGLGVPRCKHRHFRNHLLLSGCSPSSKVTRRLSVLELQSLALSFAMVIVSALSLDATTVVLEETLTPRFSNPSVARRAAHACSAATMATL